MRRNHTVADWIRLRFREDYPSFTVTVLRDNGRPATGPVLLANLRPEYDRGPISSNGCCD